MAYDVGRPATTLELREEQTKTSIPEDRSQKTIPSTLTPQDSSSKEKLS